MADEKTTQPANTADSAKAKAAPKAKKEKPPKLEDKPFNEFMEQHFVPGLDKALKDGGWEGVELMFDKSPLAVKGAESDDVYWQVQGDRKSTRLNSQSRPHISYAVFCLKKKKSLNLN